MGIPVISVNSVQSPDQKTTALIPPESAIWFNCNFRSMAVDSSLFHKEHLSYPDEMPRVVFHSHSFQPIEVEP